MISLDELVDTEALGRVPAKVAIGSLVADPGFAPKEWQAHAPDNAYNTNKLPVQDDKFGELQRIKALPRRAQLRPSDAGAEALIDRVTARYSRGPRACACNTIHEKRTGAPGDCITRLNHTQAWALEEIAREGGLFGPIGVGHGKTILDILAVFAFEGAKVAVMLVPVGLVGQLITEYELLSEHFRTPMLLVHGAVQLPGESGAREYNEIHRYMPDGTPAPRLHVLPYSRLSTKGCAAKLEEIKPDVFIMDECHNLRNVNGRTSRVLRYFDKHKGDEPFPSGVGCAAYSGSVTGKSLKDYAHIIAMALKDKSPLPQVPEVVDDWCRGLDPRTEKDKDGKRDVANPWNKAAPPGALFELDDGQGGHISEIFHRRLVQSPGVVATTTAAIEAALSIEEEIAPPIPIDIEIALNKLRETWCRPDGEELLDAMTVAACARQLACGFFYRWHFRKLVDGKPQEVGKILTWLEVRKAYRHELRYKLQRRAEYLDTPHLCELAAKRFHGDLAIPPRPADKTPAQWEVMHPVWESEFWPLWRDTRNTVAPLTEAIRIDPYLAQAAAEWGRSHHGIIWYESDEFGTWVAELSGLTKHSGGPDAPRLLALDPGDRSIICSIKSHGTGRDGLQKKYSDQLIAQPPSSSDTWEQLLGRLHRIRQKAPIVHARFYRHTPELQSHVDSALAKALYVQTTIGSAQKLLTGFVAPEAIAAVGRTEIDLDAIAEIGESANPFAAAVDVALDGIDL